SPGAGFFSNFSFVLNHLKIADKLGVIPVVDFKHFKTLYNENNVINDTENAWEYYFEQVSSYNLKEVYSSKYILVTDSFWGKEMCFQVTRDPELYNIYKKYIKIKKDIITEFEWFIKDNYQGEKILGCHFRGQEMKTARRHPLPPTKKQICFKIDKLLEYEKYTKIFLSTECLSYYEYLKNRYGDKVIAINSYRSYKNAYSEFPRKSHRYYLGRDILIEAILLSKADGLLCGDSNVSEIAAFMANKNNNYLYKIDNGINSSHWLVSKYLWFYKALVPPVIGGFKIDAKN
ncbi:MAG: hypothetical protein HGB12_14940, partial [Bacteroidetes bacterium]|nr:hypothetical protein [Bacteroidota bacterium]